MKLIPLLTLLLLTVASARAEDPTSFTFERLQRSGKKFSPEFISALGKLKEETSPGSVESEWQLNINKLITSAYLRPKVVKGKFSSQTDAEAIDLTYEFVKKNSEIFAIEEKQYGVPRSAIASLIWIETKLGTFMGNVPVVEAFFALAGCDHESRVEGVLRAIRSEPEIYLSRVTSLSDAELRIKIRDRARKKIEWAVGELKSLDLLYREDLKLGRASTRDIFNWVGSYAGAFGVGQFLPTSYRAYAVSEKGGSPDLYNPHDAILSTGRFLSRQWAKSRTDALMNYNALKVYGASILEVAGGVEAKLKADSRK